MAVNQPLPSLLVDLEKADHSVPMKSLWKALEPYNISNSIIRAIKRLNENSFSKIEIGKQLSQDFIYKKDYDKDVVNHPLYLKYIFKML